VHSTLRGIAGIFTAGRLARRASTGIAAMVLLVCGLALTGTVGQAGQERYEYDPIGRLVRFIDGNNQVTEYKYDAAGNILSVTRASAASLAPSISAVTPSVIRRGETKAITLTGQRLDVGTLQTSDAGMDLSGLTLGATQVTASLTVAPSVPVGTQTLTFSNAVGTAQIGLLIAPTLPVLTVEPSPLALPPDNTARAITVRLSGVDVVAHTIGISSSDVSKATVSPASVVIAAGQTTAQVNITPKASGFATLTLTSPTLQTVTAPVFVTSDFRGVNTSHAAPVGLVVGSAQPPAEPVSGSATFAAPRVGVAVGPVLTGVTPEGMIVGASHSLAVNGSGIPAAVQFSVVPPQGVTATWTVDVAGNRIAATLDVSPSATAGIRRIVVTDTAGNLIPFADPARSRITLTTGQPTITSLTPLFAAPNTVVKMVVRGANLQNGKLVISPSTDLQIDAAPVVNADGTELVASVYAYPLAATGPRVVQIATPSGQSTSQANSANQFTIVSQITGEITPIMSPLVGLVVGTSTPPTGTATVGPVQAANVGLVVGASANAVTPSVGVLGTTVNLVVTGSGLQSVQTATIAAPDGLTIGAFSVNAEGTQLTFPVAVDAGAPRGLRRVLLSTATGKLPFSTLGGDQFLVAAPAPALVSVSPQVLGAGKTATVTVRGKNFTDVVGVQFDPATGLTAVPPFTVTQGNTVLSFAVQVDATAPTGVRTVIVNTAGGQSSNVPTPANTVQVAQQVGSTYDAILAPLVGVSVGASTPPQTTETLGVFALPVGVVVASTPTQETRTDSVHANAVGVVVGVAAAGVTPRSPDGFLKGSSGSLVIDGFALDAVSSVTIVGTTGVSLGAHTVNGAATQLTVPVTVSPTTPSSTFGVRLVTGSGTATVRVTALDPQAMTFNVGSLPVTIDSVSPIVLEQGKNYTFTVRGSNLKDVYQLFAEPSPGLSFGGGGTPAWSTDAFGEKLTIPLLIDGNAAIGSRAVRMRVPGGSTSPDATQSNTITIVAPQ
jgi:YD repeat-containing protein